MQLHAKTTKVLHEKHPETVREVYQEFIHSS
jgi:hypothetical protein